MNARSLGLVLLLTHLSAGSALAQLTLRVTDYAALPITGVPEGAGNDGSLARVNFLREEPGGAKRFFVNDLNGPLYILDKASKQFAKYLDFNGAEGRPGLYQRFTYQRNFAMGLINVVLGNSLIMPLALAQERGAGVPWYIAWCIIRLSW